MNLKMKNMNFKLINKKVHPYLVRRVMRAYNKQVDAKLKAHPELAKPVDSVVTKQHLDLYGRLGYPCSDKWLKLYCNLTGFIDYTYLPDDLFYGCIERVMNDCNRSGFEAEDKNLISIYVDKEYLPEIPLRFIRGMFMDEDYNVLSINKVNNLLKSDIGDLIGKVAVASLGGLGVTCFSFKQGKYINGDGIELTSDWIMNNFNSYLLQKKVTQCDFSAMFNRYSANTCRITTLRCPWDGNVVVAKAGMRFGASKEAIDNMTSGGVCVGIGHNGELGEAAFRYSDLKRFDVHPSSGVPFYGKTHPFYKKMCEVVISLAKKIPNYNILSWDVIADNYGNIKILEVNQNGQGTHLHQFAYGSVFGIYTEKLIDWVSANKKYDDFKHFRSFNY